MLPPKSAPTPTPPALEEVFQGLRRVMAALRGRFQVHLASFGLTFPQWMMLKALAKDGRHTVRELADRMGSTPANVTGIVDRLERDGLVVRSRSSEDRRVVYVRLTERGHEKTVELRGCGNAVLADMFDGWSDEDLAQFRDLLDQVKLRPDDQTEL